MIRITIENILRIKSFFQKFFKKSEEMYYRMYYRNVWQFRLFIYIFQKRLLILLIAEKPFWEKNSWKRWSNDPFRCHGRHCTRE